MDQGELTAACRVLHTAGPGSGSAYTTTTKLPLMGRERGFTLLELLVTIAVAAILLGIGIPSLQTTIASNRLAAQTNALISTLAFARTEAMKRGAQVVVCRSKTGTSCTTGSGTGGWEQGWIVTADSLGSPGTTEVLATQAALAGGNTLTGDNNLSNRVTYTAQGMSTTFGTLSLCDAKRAGYKREIIIASTGRARVERLDGNGSGCE